MILENAQIMIASKFPYTFQIDYSKKIFTNQNVFVQK
jgi:hypothetical protein